MHAHQDWTPVVIRKKYTDLHDAEQTKFVCGFGDNCPLQRDGKTVTKDRPVQRVGGQGWNVVLQTTDSGI